MPYPTEVLADNPKIYYRLNESSGTAVIDSSPNALHGTSANCTLAQPSVLGTDTTNTRYQFNGTTSGVVSNTNAIGTPVNFSAECIFTPTAFSGVKTILARYDVANSGGTWIVRFNNAQLEFYIWRASGSNTHFDPVYTWTLNTAYHIVVTCQGGASGPVRVYITNGDTMVTSTFNFTLPATTGWPYYPATNTFFRVGRSGLASEFFSGYIDEAAIYETVLSPARVTAHAAQAFADPSLLEARNAAHEVEVLGTVTPEARSGAHQVEVLGTVAEAQALEAAFSTEVLGTPVFNTQAQFGSLLDYAVVQLDPADMHARVGGVVAQVAIQIQRGYVTDFQGNPVMVWHSDGQRYPVRTF